MIHNDEFETIVDSVLLQFMDLGKRAREARSLVDLRNEVRTVIKTADQQLGTNKGSAWWYARYAICCWIDWQIIQEKPEWREKPIEADFYGHGEAHVKFFDMAANAREDQLYQALRVFFIVFIFGFRGIYGDNDPSRIPNGLPTSPEDWHHDTASSLNGIIPRPASEWDRTETSKGIQDELNGRSSLSSMLIFFFFSLLLCIATWFLK